MSDCKVCDRLWIITSSRCGGTHRAVSGGGAKGWTPPGRLGVGLAAVLMLLMTGCGSQVTVKQSFPEPVMRKLPNTVGLYLDKDFVNYVHTEKSAGGSDWTIDLGEANGELFRRLLTGIFQSVTDVQRINAGAGVDVVIRPKIADFQFSTPGRFGNGFFEAWIEYRVCVHRPDGAPIVDWPVTAYGRRADPLLRNSEALREAVELAMRDAAAALALRLPDEAALRTFLNDAEPASGSPEAADESSG